MDLTSPKIIKEFLSKYETRPSKGLGQNFLIDENILKKIIKSADIKPNDIILEVGPGIGNLTRELAKKVHPHTKRDDMVGENTNKSGSRSGVGAGKVISVEKDKKMIEILKETLKDYKNIEVINADILKLNPQHYTLNPYKVVANIPYYLTSPLIRKFLEEKNPPQEMVLMLQKEVAQRICSKPPDMNLLAVSVQFYAEPKIISYVSKNCFWPAPKIDSAIIKIIPKIKKQIKNDLFFKVVKAGFSQPRKQLVNNLSKTLKLTKEQTIALLIKNNIKPNQRAETLSIEDWIKLTNSFLSTKFINKIIF